MLAGRKRLGGAALGREDPERPVPWSHSCLWLRQRGERGQTGLALDSSSGVCLGVGILGPSPGFSETK